MIRVAPLAVFSQEAVIAIVLAAVRCGAAPLVVLGVGSDLIHEANVAVAQTDVPEAVEKDARFDLAADVTATGNIRIGIAEDQVPDRACGIEVDRLIGRDVNRAKVGGVAPSIGNDGA